MGEDGKRDLSEGMIWVQNLKRHLLVVYYCLSSSQKTVPCKVLFTSIKHPPMRKIEFGKQYHNSIPVKLDTFWTLLHDRS